jgi:hypothetical protein
MAKIGTAHIEVKPVVDEVALEAIAERIATAVAEGVERGMARANRKSLSAGPFIDKAAHS